MEVNLPRDLQVYLEDRVASRASRSIDEAVTDALRLLRAKDEQQEKFFALQEDIMVGIEASARGETAPLDVDAILAEVLAKATQKKGA